MDLVEFNDWFVKKLSSAYTNLFTRVDRPFDTLTEAFIDDPRGERYELKLIADGSGLTAYCHGFHAHFYLCGDGDRDEELADAVEWLNDIKRDALIVYAAWDIHDQELGAMCCDPAEEIELEQEFPCAARVEVFSHTGTLDRSYQL